MPDNVLWEHQLRVIVSYWLERTMEISGLTVPEIASRAGINKSFLYRIRRRESTPSGEVMDAIAKIVGVPVPALSDGNDYGKLYSAQLATSRPSGSAAGRRQEQQRRDALATELAQQAAAKKAKRRRGGGKG